MQRFSKHWGVVIFFVCKREPRLRLNKEVIMSGFNYVKKETFEQMKSAVISAAVQGPGNVRINSENFHQLKTFQIDS